mmetsp:Transcript_89222/g.186469  ORF Transcript_89222/g.186469 Transcript_89222/m.186469 type:complete len:213 (+) Transcript_89222:959-1597(+)
MFVVAVWYCETLEGLQDAQLFEQSALIDGVEKEDYATAYEPLPIEFDVGIVGLEVFQGQSGTFLGRIFLAPQPLPKRLGQVLQTWARNDDGPSPPADDGRISRSVVCCRSIKSLILKRRRLVFLWARGCLGHRSAILFSMLQDDNSCGNRRNNGGCHTGHCDGQLFAVHGPLLPLLGECPQQEGKSSTSPRSTQKVVSTSKLLVHLCLTPSW